MTKNPSRRSFLAGLGAFGLAGTARAAPPETSLFPAARPDGLAVRAGGGIEGLIARRGLPGEVVCAVADVKTGLRLEASKGQQALPPASVLKILTALYALDVLGPEHRFVTRVVADGPIRDGVLLGDLILVGGGDPSLNTDHLALLAGKLKEKGLHEVRGDFLVFTGALPDVHSIDPGQPDQLGYSPAVTGIALNYNRVHFQWTQTAKGYAVQMDARTKTYRPDVKSAVMRVADRRTPVYDYAMKDGIDHWSVAKKALGKGGSRWLPVRKPGTYAGDVFGTMARSNGIVLKPAKLVRVMPDGTEILAEHRSPALESLVRGMLKYSNNLTAEMVGLSASAASGTVPASLQDSAAQMVDWAAAKYGLSGTSLVDHSGLGDGSRMTPDGLVEVLVQAHGVGRLKPLLKPFAMLDRKGRPDKNHPVKVQAKTGTLNFVSGLGGYATAADGTELAFAIFTADLDRRAKIRREDREVAEGARPWNRQAKRLQRELLDRWGRLYGS